MIDRCYYVMKAVYHRTLIRLMQFWCFIMVMDGFDKLKYIKGKNLLNIFYYNL